MIAVLPHAVAEAREDWALPAPNHEPIFKMMSGSLLKPFGEQSTSDFPDRIGAHAMDSTDSTRSSSLRLRSRASRVSFESCSRAIESHWHSNACTNEVQDSSF